VTLKTILKRLRKEHPEWGKLSSEQGVQAAITHYAERNGLPDLINKRDKGG
jgi:hypothetical protein